MSSSRRGIFLRFCCLSTTLPVGPFMKKLNKKHKKAYVNVPSAFLMPSSGIISVLKEEIQKLRVRFLFSR